MICIFWVVFSVCLFFFFPFMLLVFLGPLIFATKAKADWYRWQASLQRCVSFSPAGLTFQRGSEGWHWKSRWDPNREECTEREGSECSAQYQPTWVPGWERFSLLPCCMELPFLPSMHQDGVFPPLLGFWVTPFLLKVQVLSHHCSSHPVSQFLANTFCGALVYNQSKEEKLWPT